MPGPTELPSSALRRTCDASGFKFTTTADLPPLDEVLGQPRAVAALEFGVEMASQGFNLFALGQPGSGRTTLIRDYLERRAATSATPPDTCYVYNFGNPRSPAPLHLPAGRGRVFGRDIDALIAELKTAIPKAFEKDEYTSHRDRIVHEFESLREHEIENLEQSVERSGFQLVKAPGGFMLAPASSGKIITEQDLEKLSAEDRDKVARARERVQREIEAQLRGIREKEKEARQSVAALDQQTASYAAGHLVDDVREKYRELPAVVEWLGSLQRDLVENADDFRKSKEIDAPQNPLAAALGMQRERSYKRYEVNVLVDNSELDGAPVIVETNPTYHNLTGRIEHHSTLGEVHTDHTMIKSGALHRAAGGYLLIPARECLLNPYAWEGLKRSLKDRVVHVEELGTQLSLISTVTLAPEPVPLDTKVVLIGTPTLYYLLLSYDEDFQKLFKVKAEFTSRMDRTPENERAYAVFAGAIAKQQGGLPLDPTAVARVVEYGSRMAEDQDKLSTIFGDIADLIREASHRASKNAHGAINAEDIRVVEGAQRFRRNLMEERLQEAITEGTILVETEGMAVARVNGLSVVGQGDYQFGHPSRITASAGPGRGGVVSIEREVEMSGPIHGKGVLILGGYLMRMYGEAGPLSLSASLVFEQMYGMVEGDSASLAELCCLLSALSGVALRQDVAVTGSVNQHGQVQPVGGVTEKVEGFFDICAGRGLSGTQGVLLPATNRRTLMLRDGVVEASAAGKFHVWVAETVDDALALLTGGDPEVVHQAVARRLESYKALLKAHGEAKNGKQA